MWRPTHFIVLAAFVFSCGGQWAVLQCVAWANMVREYSEMVPLPRAVEMTFSGDYPCPICKAIAEKNSAEQQKAMTLGKYDKKFPPSLAEHSAQPALSSPVVYFDRAEALRFWSESPAVPPPRTKLS